MRSVLLGADLTTGHKIALIVVAAAFIVFALASSFLVPRYKRDFPGPAGLSVFVIVSLFFFGAMIAAINFFG
jgi:hypothetical protein